MEICTLIAKVIRLPDYKKNVQLVLIKKKKNLHDTLKKVIRPKGLIPDIDPSVGFLCALFHLFHQVFKKPVPTAIFCSNYCKQNNDHFLVNTNTARATTIGAIQRHTRESCVPWPRH